MWYIGLMNNLETIVKELLDALGVRYSSVTRKDVAGQSVIAIESEDGPRLIGNRGETLHAIDHVVKKIAEQRSPKAAAPEGGEREREPMILIDVNDYQVKRIKDLQTKALMMAERARSFQYDVELSPMSSYERLIVHTTLQDAPNVKTESQGEGRNRRVVIKYSTES
jgi:spoIIIJ-associated protein